MKWVFRLLLIAFIGYLLTGLTQVRPEEKAVVRRFGAVVDSWEPGLHMGLPWGIDRVDRIPVLTLRQIRVGYAPDQSDATMPIGQLLTADQNLVNVQVAVDYSIDDSSQGLADYLAQRDQVEAVVVRTVEALLAEWVAAHAVDEVLLTGSGALPRWLMAELPRRIDPFRLGIQFQQASVAYLSPPDEVKSAFEEVNRAQTTIRTLENKAQQEGEQRMRIAEAEANRLEQTAQAYTNEKRTLARAEAISFVQRLEQYHRLRKSNPDVLTAIWWDEMSRVFASMKSRGRIDVLDQYLGADGLDITQFLPPTRRR